MADQITNYTCPACGGPLTYNGSLDKLQCDFCGSIYEPDQFEAQMQERNAAAAQSFQTAGGSGSWGAEDMKSYSCPSCAATLICDSTTAATCCPYCGSQTVIPGQFSGSLKPEFVIPFKTDKEQAKAALKNHYKGKRLLPKSFVEDNHIEEIQGVYVPFWMFDCTAAGDIAYEAKKISRKDQSDREIITTRHYDVYRRGSLPFSMVPADASSRMPDGHMDSIEPYDYSQLKPFSMAYMPGFLADKYDVEADVCGQRVEERCQKTFANEARRTVQGYDEVRETHRNVQIQKGTAHYALLPVWLLATKWNGKDFLFAMNGQSGRLVGDLPVDKGKYWGYFAGIAAILIGLMLAVNAFLLHPPMTGMGFAVGCIAVPVLMAWIVVTVMKSKMKSVAVKQEAAQYVTGKGLQLDQRQDVFVNTTTETRMKNKGSK